MQFRAVWEVRWWPKDPALICTMASRPDRRQSGQAARHLYLREMAKECETEMLNALCFLSDRASTELLPTE